MKSFGVLRSRGVAIKAAAGFLVLAASTAARADLPPWATAIGEDLTGAVTDSAELVGPVVALSIVSVLVIKLIKRFSSKV